MKPSITSFILACSAAVLLSGCSQFGWQKSSEAETQPASETAEDRKPVKLRSPITTVKPGAGITVDPTLSDNIMPGQNGIATLSVFEPYSEGTLIITSTGTEGLNVFGAETTARIDMTRDAPHTVRLSYSADTDGLYYINIAATTVFSDGREEARAYAVRVEIGDWKTAVEKAGSGDIEMSPDGEPMVILEAEETIE